MLFRSQDLLGRLHDLEVLIERARQTQASLSPPLLKTWREVGLLVRALEDDCRALHAHYVRSRTKLLAIANRVAAVNADVAPDRRAAG